MDQRPLRLPGISAEAGYAVLLVVLSGAAAVLQGQDANIDLYRYRLYVGYAFVHGRLDQDLVPSALSTFLNPTLDSLHYLGITHLPPRVFSFLLGSLQGLNAVLVLLLARAVLPSDRGGRLLAALAALVAASGPTARSLLGTTLGDTTVSLPALGALLVALRAAPGASARSAALRLLASGLLAGAAVGLKLTMAPAGIALAAVVAAGVASRTISIVAASCWLWGAVLGYLAVAGYWCLQLWERFGNPLFPYLNQVFRSPYLPSVAIRDARWAAHGVVDYLSPPFDIARGLNERLQEIPFRDLRYLLVVLALLAWLVMRASGRRPPLSAGARGLLIYFAAGYAIWALAFYYYRYASFLEFLAPLVLVVLVHAASPSLAPRLLVGATLLVLVTSSVGSWGRREFGERWFNVRLPPQAHEPGALVLLDSPLSSFLIPYFPRATSFAGLEGTGSTRLDELLAARVAAHEGGLFWLVSRGRPAESTSPEHLGLTVTDDCGLIRTGEGRWALCRVVRAGGPRH